jgi:hypothetical protein
LTLLLAAAAAWCRLLMRASHGASLRACCSRHSQPCHGRWHAAMLWLLTHADATAAAPVPQTSTTASVLARNIFVQGQFCAVKAFPVTSLLFLLARAFGLVAF